MQGFTCYCAWPQKVLCCVHVLTLTLSFIYIRVYQMPQSSFQGLSLLWKTTAPDTGVYTTTPWAQGSTLAKEPGEWATR